MDQIDTSALHDAAMRWKGMHGWTDNEHRFHVAMEWIVGRSD